MKRALKLFACLALAAAAAPVCAQTYPTKLVRIVVNFPVGGPADVEARLLANKMTTALKQPVIVDNKPGAAGNIGADQVAKAAPDGYTVLWTSDTVFTVNPLVYAKLPFDPDKDFKPVAIAGGFAQVLVVNPKFKADNLANLVTLAKTQRLSYSTGGSGSPGHLTMEYFLDLAGINMVHVPYKGVAQSSTALLAGEVDAGFLTIAGPTLNYIKSGKFKALAVSSNERLPFLPDVPTAAEAGYKGFDTRFLNYVMVPAATPNSVVDILYEQTAAALKAPDVRQTLESIGIEVIVARGAEVTKRMQADRAKWAPIVKKAKIHVD